MNELLEKSPYADCKKEDFEFDEVYAEYRTMITLQGGIL